MNFARAADIAADLGTDIVRLQARTFERLCTGQIRETVGPAEGEDAVAHHLDVLAGKTGSLIAARAFLGLGAAMLIPLAFSLLVVLFDREERPRAMVLLGLVALGSISRRPRRD